MVQNNSKYILDYILIAPLIKVFRINIAISLNVSWNKNVHDDPLLLSHFWLLYVHIFHFGKYQELFNSRSKMAHLPLNYFTLIIFYIIIYTYMYVYVHMYVCIRMYIYIYLYMYVYVYIICMYMFI